jgi:hypothetical protein
MMPKPRKGVPPETGPLPPLMGVHPSSSPTLEEAVARMIQVHQTGMYLHPSDRPYLNRLINLAESRLYGR